MLTASELYWPEVLILYIYAMGFIGCDKGQLLFFNEINETIR